MTNIIYNFFLQKYFSQDADLKHDPYKLALLTEDYTPSVGGVENYTNFEAIQQFECVDENPLVEDNPNEGYKKGGKPITFNELEPDSDIYKKYSCGDITFKNVSFSGDNAAAYAVIYRDTKDKLLVACFKLDMGPYTLEGEDLTLSWANVVTIQISANLGISVDSNLDTNSDNPVQNRAISERMEKIYSSMAKYGIRLNDELTPTEDNPNPDDDDWAEENDVDTLSRISDSSIDDIFNED